MIEAEMVPLHPGWHDSGAWILCLEGGASWCPHGNSKPMATGEASVTAHCPEGP